MSSTHVIKSEQLLKDFIASGRRERRLTIKWPSEASTACPLCHSPIRFKHMGGKRWVQMLQWILIVRNAYYSCSNSTCALHHPFTVPNDIVLPFKRQGRDVWEKVIMVHIKQKLAPDRIVIDLATNFGYTISAATVARIIETYEILKSSSVDEKSLAKVRKAGFIMMAVDGQRPETGKPGLWYVVDVVSNVVLHVEYLTCADATALGKMFVTIEQKYGVLIKAVLSDHQASIVNAVAEYLPIAVHQYCHFHFLKNLAEPLEAIDSHLQKVLEIGIRGLYINHANRESVPTLIGGVKEPIRDFFKPVMEDLVQLITNRRKLFDKWAGLVSFINVKKYVPRLKELQLAMPEGSRARSTISKTISVVDMLLETAQVHADKLEFLVTRLDEIRSILGTENDTPWSMHMKAHEWVQEQEWYLHEARVDISDNDRRIAHLNYDTTVTDVLGQWVHLFNSHEDGLFHFMAMPGLPRANSSMEREFSVENRFFRSCAGTAMVGHSIRVKGDVMLKILKDHEANGTNDGNSIQTVLDTHDRAIISHGSAIFKERRSTERKTWNMEKKNVHGVAKLVKHIISIKRHETA
jgi:hypothetical protein